MNSRDPRTAFRRREPSSVSSFGRALLLGRGLTQGDPSMNTLLSSIPDSPTRTAPPDEDGPMPFSERCRRSQLDILERLTFRSKWWREVAEEALAESKQVPALVNAALDVCQSDAAVGARLREVMIDYAERCAEINGSDLAEEAQS